MGIGLSKRFQALATAVARRRVGPAGTARSTVAALKQHASTLLDGGSLRIESKRVLFPKETAPDLRDLGSSLLTEIGRLAELLTSDAGADDELDERLDAVDRGATLAAELTERLLRRAFDAGACPCSARLESFHQLNESRTWFRMLAEHIDSVFWVATPGGERILYVSPSYERVWGRSRDALIAAPESALGYVHPADRARFLEALPDHARGKWDIEYRILRPDGAVRWIHDRGFAERDGQGNIVRLYGLADDISARRRREETTHAWAEFVLNHSGPALQLDRRGLVVRFNRAAGALFGRNLDGQHIDKFLPALRVERPGQELGDRELEAHVGDVQYHFRLQTGTHGMTYYVHGTDVSALTAAKRELTRERALLRSVIDSIPDLIFYKDLDGVYLGCNVAFERFAGVAQTELRGKTDFDLFPRDVATFFREQDQEMLAKRESRSNEEQVTHAAGHTLLLDTLKTHFTTDEGELLGLIGISRDITARHEAAARLRASEEQLRVLVANVPAAVAMLDRDFRYLSYSRRWVAEHGLQGSALRGVSHFELFPDNIAHWRQILERGLRGAPAACEADRFVSSGGASVWLRWEVHPWLDESGEVAGLILATEDITVRRETEERLNRLAAVAQETDNLVVITDVDGYVEWVNAAFERTTGYSLEEVKGLRPGAVLQGPDTDRATVDRIRRAIRKRRPVHAELLNYDKHGSAYWIEISIKPIFDESGALIEFMAIENEITKRKQRAEELSRAKEAAESANLAKSAFLANMSHEIRTPLNAILGFSQLLQRDSRLDREHHQHLTTINRSGEHLLALINDVLQMSKIEAGRLTLNPAAFDLHKSVESIRAMFFIRAENKGIELVFFYEDRMPRHIVADEGKLRQVIINLVSNAVKFTDRGSVTARISVDGAGNAGKRSLRVVVEDTGPGISIDQQAQVFRAFEQSDTGRKSGTGTGLGLAICKQFVGLMGGEITLTSNLGEGARFEFTVPVEESEARPRSKRRRVQGLRPGTGVPTILVVDDNEDNRALLRALLSEAGLRLREASDGLEALERFDAERPDLLLLDMAMPVMDGYAVARAIREREAAEPSKTPTPILAVTASAFEADRAAVLDAGADEFLRKPIDVDELFRCLGIYLGMEIEYRQGETGTLSYSHSIDLRPIAELPAHLKQSLHRAAIAADADALHEDVERAAELSPTAGPTLRRLAENYAYDALVNALEID